jgi:exonuclease SbcC
MKFKRIKINNIRSYENAEIFLPQGSVLLSGDIGTGKTSILIAIEFALFGLQPGQKGASLLKTNTDEGSVELEFEIDEDIIILQRNLKRKKTVTQDSTFITINGKTEEKATTEVKNFVLQKLNYPLEFAKKTNLLYRFTVYTPQEQMKQIITEDPETRLNTLRHVFGIDKYKRIKENTTTLTAKLRENSRMSQGQIADLETRKANLQERISSLEKTKSIIPGIEAEILLVKEEKSRKESDLNEVKEKIEEKRTLDTEVQKTNILLMTKKEQITKFTDDIKSIEEKLQKATESFNEEEFSSIIKNIEDKKLSKETLTTNLTEITGKVSSLLSKKYDLEKLKEKISHLRNCPTCLQDVSDTHKHAIFSKTENEMSLIDKEKESIDSEKQTKENLINEINLEITSLEEKKNILQETKIRLKTIQEDSQRKGAMEKQLTILTSDTSMLENQITTLKESISELKKFDQIFEIKTKEFDEIHSKEKQLEIKKAETLREINLNENEIELNKKEIAEKENIKKRLMYTVELENWLANDFSELIGTIERNVMVKLKSEFSSLFNTWFSILVPDTFTVSLNDDFTPVIEQQDYELDYSFLSGGERTAIALAYRLALNQTINSLLSEIKTKGIVILDEPTEGFSQQQLDKMRDVLAELDVEQLILVSHDQKIESFVDHVIKLKKENLATRVV